MDTQNKRSKAAVDDILDELKGRKSPPVAPSPSPKRDKAALDNILAELGVAPKKPAGTADPATEKEAASAAKAALSKTLVLPSGELKAPAPEPEKPKRAPQPEVFDPVKPEPKPTMERPSQRMNRINKGRTSILDIEVEHTTGIQRVGKAAAMDKVDGDKYQSDEELLSWFSPEQPLSKREKRRMEKERKKQEAEDRRLEKRRAASEDPDGGAAEEKDFSMFAPSAGEAAVEDGPVAEAEEALDIPPFEEPHPEPEPEPAPPPKAKKPRKEPLQEPGWVVVDSSVQVDFTADTTTFTPPPKQEATAEPAALDTGNTMVFDAPKLDDATDLGVDLNATLALDLPELDAAMEKPAGLTNTQTYELQEVDPEDEKVPTAAFTQEFATQEKSAVEQMEEKEGRSLFLDDMVDDRFRAFFGETVIVDKEEVQVPTASGKVKRRSRKVTRTSLFTGEFAQLALEAEAQEAVLAAEEYAGEATEEEDAYSRPQDAEQVEADLEALKKSLTIRTIATGALGVLLLWLGFGFSGALPLPGFLQPAEHPLLFGIVYMGLILAAIGVNFTTIASGLVGLGGEPTVDTPPALAALFALLQSVVLLVGLLSEEGAAAVTLFGSLAAFILAVNALGKRIRARVILDNFHLTAGGFDHSAAYIVDGAQHDIAHNITVGLEEENPVLLVSRPTAFVKGFMKQSFSLRRSDYTGRVLGWILGGVAILAAILAFVLGGDLLTAISSAAAVLCIGAPVSSTLVSAVPSALMQQNNAKVGAVVPGWSAIEELSDVNVVMAGGRDVFPPSSVQLKGIKTFEKERIDHAILYAASVLIDGCDTMRDIFLGVIQGKSDMLYKVESLTKEPGRGFTAWVENHRVVIGSREMLQRHDIVPPPIEAEMKYTSDNCCPVYLAVSGKLFAMFVVRYTPDEEVAETLESLVNSGLSLLITSDDMNITAPLIEAAYNLPTGVVKVLGLKELNMLEPMTSYQPESAGVMSHIGTFTSFIGGMRSAAGCALSEKWSGIVQLAAVILAALICLMLVASGGLATLGVSIALLYQAAWTVMVCATPFLHRF